LRKTWSAINADVQATAKLVNVPFPQREKSNRSSIAGKFCHFDLNWFCACLPSKCLRSERQAHCIGEENVLAKGPAEQEDPAFLVSHRQL